MPNRQTDYCALSIQFVYCNFFSLGYNSVVIFALCTFLIVLCHLYFILLYYIQFAVILNINDISS